EVATAAMPAPATREIVTPRAAGDHAAGPRAGAWEGRPPQRTRSKTMTPAAFAANRANAQKSTGPVTPEGKRKVTRNSLEDGFFAQQEDNIVGGNSASGVVYEEIRDGLMTMSGPVNFLDKLRVRRLAALHFKRSELLERAEAGETSRSVLRYRRAVRFATPALPAAEGLENDAAALGRRSDGVEYLSARLQGLMEDIRPMKTAAEVLAAAQVCAAKLRSARPAFHADVAEAMTRADVIATTRRHLMLLKAEAQRLASEERALSDAEEARRGVPRGKHYERIMRAMRETNGEINRLEWCLAPLRSPFGAKAR